MLRMVAGLRSRPESRDNVREPTGWPSRMYLSTRMRNRRLRTLVQNVSPLVARHTSGCGNLARRIALATLTTVSPTVKKTRTDAAAIQNGRPMGTFERAKRCRTREASSRSSS